jgi:hypothetical protein
MAATSQLKIWEPLQNASSTSVPSAFLVNSQQKAKMKAKAKANMKGRTHGEGGQVLLPVRRSDDVDDDVNALASGEREHLVGPPALVFAEVDGLVGAQLVTEAQLMLQRRDDHLRVYETSAHQHHTHARTHTQNTQHTTHAWVLSNSLAS